MTLSQIQVVQIRVNIDSEEYFNILHWFITKSGHPVYENLPVLKKFSSPYPTDYNTDKSRQEEV